jgi:hypothetical protein
MTCAALLIRHKPPKATITWIAASESDLPALVQHKKGGRILRIDAVFE